MAGVGLMAVLAQKILEDLLRNLHNVLVARYSQGIALFGGEFGPLDDDSPLVGDQ